jgi:hypothetical protein
MQGELGVPARPNSALLSTLAISAITHNLVGFNMYFYIILVRFPKSWLRLSEQNLRIDKWSVCQG